MDIKEETAVNGCKRENTKNQIYELLLNTDGAMNVHQIACELESTNSELEVLVCLEELIVAEMLKMTVFPLNQKWGCSCWYELRKRVALYMSDVM